MGYWVITPDVVILPIMSASVLVNQRLPSGPGVIRNGRESKLGTKKYVMRPVSAAADREPASSSAPPGGAPNATAETTSRPVSARRKGPHRGRWMGEWRNAPVSSTPFRFTSDQSGGAL